MHVNRHVSVKPSEINDELVDNHVTCTLTTTVCFIVLSFGCLVIPVLHANTNRLAVAPLVKIAINHSTDASTAIPNINFVWNGSSLELKNKILDVCSKQTNNFNFDKYTFMNYSGLYLYKRNMNIEQEYWQSQQRFNLFSHKMTKNYQMLQTIDQTGLLHKPRNEISLALEVFPYDTKHKYMYCSIDKTGSSKVKLLYFFYSTGIRANIDTIHGTIKDSVYEYSFWNLCKKRQDWQKILNKNQRIVNHVNDTVGNKTITDQDRSISIWPWYTKFIVIRDPLKRLLSGFIDKCLINNFVRCKQLKKVPNYLELSNIELFNHWVDYLYNMIVVEGRGYVVNRHFRPQYYDCQIFDLINLFDFIILYDKIHFVSNVEYILEEIIINLRESANVDTMTVEDMIDNVDKIYNQGWNKSGTTSTTLFSTPLHHFTTTEDEEMKVIKQYYSKNIALKAFEMFSLDYQLLPFEPPLWILDLD